MKKHRKIRPAEIVIIVIALAVIAFSLYKLVPVLLDYAHSGQTYEELESKYLIVDDSDQEETEGAWWYEDVHIDLESLQKENPEVIAWIRFDDTEAMPIDYPILYSGDDEFYLHKDIYGEKSSCGCIFLEAENHTDLSDYYNLVYGHNMKNGSMFGSLKKYKQEEGFYEQNQYFTVYTNTTAYRYHIFNYHDTQDGGDEYMVGYQNDDIYQEFLDKMETKNMVESGILPTKDNKVMTLSTCTSRTATERFVVMAVLEDQHTYN